MSTYCHRIYEIKNPQGEWVALGEICDNFHGFDSWHFKYNDRGLPKDSSIKMEDLISDDGKNYTYKHSYVTAGELNELVNKETLNLKEFILRKVHNQPNIGMVDRLDFIAEHILGNNSDAFTEYTEKFKDRQDDEDGMEYFDEEFDEYLDCYDDVYSELCVLIGFCSSYGDKYNIEHYYNKEYKGEKEYFIPDSDGERIVFYFD